MRVKLLCFLMIAVPALVFAQEVKRTLDLVTPPNSAVVGVAHIEELKVGDRRQVRAIVTTDAGSAELLFDGRTITLGDGTTVVRETLANTPAVLVMRLTSATPAGAKETAIVVWNRKTGEMTQVGLDRYALLLHGSRDARMINQVLPLVAPAAATQPMSSHGLKIGTNSLFGDCFSAMIALASAMMFAEINCLSGNVPGCVGALEGLMFAGGSVYENCGTPVYDDGTIGYG